VSALPGFLTRNWTLKLSAFGIALLLWVSVRVEAPSRQAVSGVPVRVDLGDPQWAVAEDPSPATVVVRFAGPSRELIRLAVDRPAIVIPMDQVTSGDTSVVLRNQWVRVQDRPNVVVEDIQPSSVRLSFEAVQRVDLPVAPRFAGELNDRWALSGRPTAIPAEVRVSGPQSRIVELDSVRLAPVDLGAVEGSGRVGVGVDTTRTAGLQIQPARVELEVLVEERGERTVEEVPVWFGLEEGEELFELAPRSGAVVLSGARSLLDRVDPEELRLRVLLEGLELPAEPGQEIEAPVVVEGIPELVEARTEVGEVTILRLPSEAGPGEENEGTQGTGVER
jgi:YbbR domain-containing protein